MKYKPSIGDCTFDYGGHQFYEMIDAETRGKDLDYCKKCGLEKKEIEK